MISTEKSKRVITEKSLVVSSQSLLRLSGTIGFFRNAVTWRVEDYTQRAQSLGAKLMYEPLRRGLSPARDEIETAPLSLLNLTAVSLLAEQAKSEAKFSDYLTKRVAFQLIYGLLEEGRFAPTTINSLAKMEWKLAQAHHRPAFPVRVYADRRNDGLRTASILDGRLEKKIYAQNQLAILGPALKKSAGVSDNNRRAQLLTEHLQWDAARYDTAGIELSLLTLTVLLGDNPSLLALTTQALLQANQPHHPDLALVQTVSVQPSRQDFPHNVSFGAMEPALSAVQANEFAGSIVYSPGGGDAEAEAAALHQRFAFDL